MVDGFGCAVRISTRLPGLDLTREEGAAFRFVSDLPQFLGHSEAHDHASRELCCSGQIVCRAGRGLGEYQFFGRPAAQQNRQAIVELGLTQQIAILDGALHRVAKRPQTSGNDRDLLHRIGPRKGQRNQSMPHFVMGNDLAFLCAEDAALFFGAGHDPFDRLREVA